MKELNELEKILKGIAIPIGGAELLIDWDKDFRRPLVTIKMGDKFFGNLKDFEDELQRRKITVK